VHGGVARVELGEGIQITPLQLVSLAAAFRQWRYAPLSAPAPDDQGRLRA
jgi:hypothetical protein